jgi:hypothetical protein
LKYELKIINAVTSNIDEIFSADDFYDLSVKYYQYNNAHPEGGYYFSLYENGKYNKIDSCNWADYYIKKYLKEVRKLEKMKDDFK